MQNKKPVSKETRNEIKEAVESLPGLLIEHVSFHTNEDAMENDPPHKKYIPSEEKQASERKKRQIIFAGIFFIIGIIVIMMVFNMKTMLFDAKNTPSKEKQLLSDIKNNYKQTVENDIIPNSEIENKVSLSATSTTSTVTSTENTNLSEENKSILQSAIQALFHNNNSSSTSSTPQNTSSTIPILNTTSTTNTPKTNSTTP